MNDVINNKINNNFVFPNTSAQLDDTCLFFSIKVFLPKHFLKNIGKNTRLRGRETFLLYNSSAGKHTVF